MGAQDMERLNIDGHNVQFEHWMKEWAIDYMRGLDATERAKLFQGAQHNGINGATFRVSHGGPHKDFTLWVHNGEYEIKMKKEKSGWF